MLIDAPRRTLSDIRRFWSKVEITDSCWLWTGTIQEEWGYGHFSYRRDGKGFTVKAHRFAYELLVGPIPDETMVLHECDTPACVRPDHLHLGDHARNMAEMYDRGRGNKSHGTAHHASKLDDDKVREIRRRYAAGERQVPLAREFGVAQGIISDVVRRKTWRHVEDE